MFKTLIGAAALAYCLAASGAQVSATQPGSQALPVVLTVHVKNFKFDPTPAKIHVGDRVTFVNDDDEAHTVTANDKSFDSEGLDGGQTWQHVFTKPGTYDYFCELHPYMKAEIVVLPAATGSQNSEVR
jgi:plastocyanin